MKFTEEELEKVKKERMEEIDRWLDNEYGCSYTRLEELHDFVIEQDMKHQEEKDKEIERLNNIINELCWKSIEEYDRGDYDWVLIKYFDKDYECIPIVAEKRFGKWYSKSEKEIQFDVKYFFDMQQLDKLQELKGVDKE